MQVLEETEVKVYESTLLWQTDHIQRSGLTYVAGAPARGALLMEGRSFGEIYFIVQYMFYYKCFVQKK